MYVGFCIMLKPNMQDKERERERGKRKQRERRHHQFCTAAGFSTTSYFQPTCVAVWSNMVLAAVPVALERAFTQHILQNANSIGNPTMY